MPSKKVSVETLPIDSLKVAKFNPEARMKDIGQMAASIERVGLCYPVLVGQDDEVVDGHRRLAACKQLGWKDIQVLRVSGDQAELFGEINHTNRPMNGNQALTVYLQEPRAIGPRARARMEECEEAVGLPTMKRMAKEGFSMATWATAKSIARQADAEDPEMVVKTLRWVMNFRCGSLVRRALENGTSPGHILAAVNKNKPLKIRYSTAA